MLGALTGFGAVLADRGNGERIIPGEFFSESPARRVERIERGDGAHRLASRKRRRSASFLFSHNIQVSFLAFSLGALGLVAGWLLLFYNGVTLGAIAALYLLDDVQVFFLAWVGPHGSLEIPAIVFGGAAGLRLGQALLFPGDLSDGRPRCGRRSPRSGGCS